MKTLKVTGFILLALILSFGLFIGYSSLTWYNPPQELTVAENVNPDTIPRDLVLRILSWNIGYAGLGDNMDFFYDGGHKVRDSYERTTANVDSVKRFLKRNTACDFVFLQEVDIRSKRSYRINEKDTFENQAALSSSFAVNYKVKFVPIPVLSPMGSVNSGIMVLGKYHPENSKRYAFPGMFSWPTRLFQLRRCMLVNRYPVANGKEFVLINSHFSAFDDGSLKRQEMNYMKDFVQAEFGKGNYVVVGGDWNQSPPDFPLTKFGENYKSDNFLLNNIPEDFMPDGWKWAFDPSTPTNRYLNESYSPGKTFCCLIDLFLVSPNVEVLQNKTTNLNFRNSDHNPIAMEFRLKK
ncbi:MAG: endonuclease/exonuclease/phosphatase family protein [Prolixibacteraceae bacterium]|jgi:endonuclease/exonuclease/phosphatase family metal-dependent hydrolase